MSDEHQHDAPQIPDDPTESSTDTPDIQGVKVVDADSRKIRITGADLVPMGRSGILATARRNGGVVHGELRSTDVVKARGVEMTIDQALQHGLLRKSADGWTEVPAEEYERAVAAQQAEAEANRPKRPTADVPPALEREARAVDALCRQEGISSTSLMASILAGRTPSRELETLARAGNVSIEGLESHFNSMRGHLAAQMYRVLSHQGLDAEQVMKDAATEHERRSALLALYIARDLEPTLALARRFKETRGFGRGNERLPEPVKVYVDPDSGERSIDVLVDPARGKVMRMAISTARRMGYLK